jgi:formate C-acetyltransferase
VLQRGLLERVREAQEELESLRFLGPDTVEKSCFLKAVVLSLNAILRFALRFAALAEESAAKETDPVRRRELDVLAETCRRVPAGPARTFREALQSVWFTFLMINPSTTAALGRMDQYLYPFYKRDIETGVSTDEEVLELLQCLRIKDMELNRISGKANRQKNSGLAKWHNCTVGGQTVDGGDATNELTYLILEAAIACPTPHHTITLRVHERTPERLMLKGIESVKKGIGMPAFVGDKSYIEFLRQEGVALPVAHDYAMCGCLDVALPGQSRIGAYPMFDVSMVLELALNNGVDPKTRRQLGPRTGDLQTFGSFEEVMEAFKKQLVHFLSLAAEYNNIFISATASLFPDPVRTVLMALPVTVGSSPSAITSRTSVFRVTTPTSRSSSVT